MENWEFLQKCPCCDSHTLKQYESISQLCVLLFHTCVLFSSPPLSVLSIFTLWLPGQLNSTQLRCRCCKCGYSCSRELVDYRYRLSVWATRDGCIFGITVFGTCLNPFFGIHASGLKRWAMDFYGFLNRQWHLTHHPCQFQNKTKTHVC